MQLKTNVLLLHDFCLLTMLIPHKEEMEVENKTQDIYACYNFHKQEDILTNIITIRLIIIQQQLIGLYSFEFLIYLIIFLLFHTHRLKIVLAFQYFDSK